MKNLRESVLHRSIRRESAQFSGQRRGSLSMKTIWRKPTTNVAQRGGMSYTSVIQRASSGYVWRLMIHDEMVVSGKGRNRTACLDAIRSEKAKRAASLNTTLAG